MKRIVLVVLALLVTESAALAGGHRHHRTSAARHGRGVPIVAGNSSILINGVGEVLSAPPPLPRPTINRPPSADAKPAS